MCSGAVWPVTAAVWKEAEAAATWCLTCLNKNDWADSLVVVDTGRPVPLTGRRQLQSWQIVAWIGARWTNEGTNERTRPARSVLPSAVFVLVTDATAAGRTAGRCDRCHLCHVLRKRGAWLSVACPRGTTDTAELYGNEEDGTVIPWEWLESFRGADRRFSGPASVIFLLPAYTVCQCCCQDLFLDQDLGHQVSRSRPRPWASSLETPSGVETETETWTKWTRVHSSLETLVSRSQHCCLLYVPVSWWTWVLAMDGDRDQVLRWRTEMQFAR